MIVVTVALVGSSMRVNGRSRSNLMQFSATFAFLTSHFCIASHHYITALRCILALLC
jgi:hypothetical protein